MEEFQVRLRMDTDKGSKYLEGKIWPSKAEAQAEADKLNAATKENCFGGFYYFISPFEKQD